MHYDVSSFFRLSWTIKRAIILLQDILDQIITFINYQIDARAENSSPKWVSIFVVWNYWKAKS